MSALLSIVLSAFSIFAPHNDNAWSTVQTDAGIGAVHTSGTYSSVQAD
jgi:hypothetical protein